MATKKMRLTFLWADEAVAVKDYQAKLSQQLVDWASEFYGRYGFEFDILPKPGGKIQEAYRHCLSKSNGYSPDYASWEEIAESKRKFAKPRQAEIDELQQTHDTVLVPQEIEKRAQVNAILSTPLGTLTAADLETARQTFAEHGALVARIDANRKRRAELEKQIREHESSLLDESIRRNFDIPVRVLLGRKILTSFSLFPLVPLKTGNENAAIVDPHRLKVLFCRFSLKPAVLTLRRESVAFGVTPQEIDFNTLAGHFLFSGRYILINVNKFEPITLAHEMVHGAGRKHTDNQREKMKRIDQWIRSIRADPATGKLDIPPIMETVEGGYADGPDDDIVNYQSKGKKPEQVKLYDEALMTNSFFVAPPGTVPVPGA